jgi:hypothetical protein
MADYGLKIARQLAQESRSRVVEKLGDTMDLENAAVLLDSALECHGVLEAEVIADYIAKAAVQPTDSKDVRRAYMVLADEIRTGAYRPKKKKP